MVSLVEPSFDKDVARSLRIAHWYVLSVVDAQPELVLLGWLWGDVPEFVDVLCCRSLVKDVYPAENGSLCEAGARMVELPVLNRLVCY